MIEFQLDETSGVATYLQLVQQVHQALRMGMLEPGDRLPTAQQVVAQLAINPNTVHKAYRELEREGLVRARAGLGTFVTRSPAGTDPAVQARFLADLERVCDYLVVLVASRVRLAGEVSDLLASHHRLSGLRRDPGTLPAGQEIITESHTDKQSSMLVRTDGPVLDPAWAVKPVSLEDLVLAYMSRAGDETPGRRQHLGVVS